MTGMFPAMIGALVGAALYVAFDFYVLADRRRKAEAPARAARR